MSESQQDPHRSAPSADGAEPREPASTSRRGSAWRSTLFAIKAIEIRLRFVVVLVAIGLVVGYWDTIRNWWDKFTRPSAGEVVALAGEEFYCPMHPKIVRDEPDPGGAIPKCPICGMPLSKRMKGESSPLPPGVLSRVQLSPYRIELAGIRTVEATRQPLVRKLETVGYVAIDDSRRSRLVVRTGGYLEKLYVDESFVEVEQGQPLAEIYSPELYAAANELLVASRQTSGPSARFAEIAREKLRLLGVADEEIDEIVRSGEAKSRLILRAPHGGRVFRKMAVEGDRVEAGEMLFEVADLSEVWVESDLFEKDASLVEVGQAIEAKLEAYPGETFRGEVALIHPHVEASTRTLRVRFRLPNHEGKLRPGMYATVTLETPIDEIEPFRSRKQPRLPQLVESAETPDDDLSASEQSFVSWQGVCPVTGLKLGSMGTPVRATADGEAVFLCCAGCEDEIAARPAYYLDRIKTVAEDGVLAVPETAVIDTGKQQIVYVEREPGLFEGVAVTLGPLADGRYAVIDGLLSGDRVAAAGTFLIDAETRLNPAASAAYFGAGGGPSAEMPTTSTGGARASSTFAGFSESQKASLAKLSPADCAAAERQKICPVTGLNLGAMGQPIKVAAGGKTLYLCCEGCREKALADPEAAFAKIRAVGGEVAE